MSDAVPYRDATLTFISDQLKEISSKIDGLDSRLRSVEIGLVQKEEIKAIELRLTNLEHYKIKLAAWLSAGTIVISVGVQILWHWLSSKIGAHP